LPFGEPWVTSPRRPAGPVESRDAVVRALAILTSRQRAAIVLTEVLGLTSVEAAEALRVKPPTVRVLAARAREVLKDRLKEDDG
jgi:RNA polymerase sigma factor (sigma-70 family)